MRYKVDHLSLSWEVDTLSFGGYISIRYTPISQHGGLEQLGGSFIIGGNEEEETVGEAKRLLQRAKTLAQALGRLARKDEYEVEVEGSVVRIPFEVREFEGRTDVGTLRIAKSPAHGGSINQTFKIDGLAPGLQRAVYSLSTTLERMAWDDLRRKLALPAVQPGSAGIHVFISYRNLHEHFAESLAQRLGDEGIIPWFDKWDILAGDSVTGEIEKGLQESAAFVPIITADYQEGTWATEELQSAIAKRVETDFRIVPVLLEDCERPELIRHLRYVDFTAQDPETFESKVGELIDGIYGLTVNPFRQ